MTQTDPEVRKKQLATALKWGAALLAGFIVAPFVFQAIGGLIGIVIALAVGVAIQQLAPLYTMAMANLTMKLLVGEARRNPIETMRNIYVDNMKTIQEKDQKIAEFAGRLDDFKDKMADFGKKYPEEVVKYQEVAKKMTTLLARQVQKQKMAKAAAKLYSDQITKAEAIYQMACAARDVQTLAGKIEKQVFQDIMKQVAFDSVTHQFNTAVAELTVETDTEPDFSIDSTPQLPEKAASAGAEFPSGTIDFDKKTISIPARRMTS